VAPDETVLVASGNTDSATTVDFARLEDGDPREPNGSYVVLHWQAAAVLQSSSTSVKFVVPAAMAPGVYAYRLHSHGASSGASLINAPDIWFVQGDQGESAVPGGWLQVHGTAVGSRGGQARLALVHDERTVAVIEAEAGGSEYAQRFKIPINLPPNRYDIYVHNGMGGPGAWSRYEGFVEAPEGAFGIAPAPGSPAGVVDVSKQAGANDDARFAAAIATLGAGGGGVLYVPPGSYSLTRQLALPPHTILRGAGRSRSTLRWTQSPTSGGAGTPKQIALITGAPLGKGIPDRASVAIEDIGVVAAPDFTAYAIEDTFSSAHGGVSRASIAVPNIGEFDTKTGTHPTAIFLRRCKNFEIVDTELDAANGVFAREGVSFLRIENDRFNWTESTITFSGRSHNFVVSGNTFNLRGTAEEDGWTAVASRQKGTNPNPGFWFTSFYGTSLPGTSMGGPYVRDLYYANNRSSRDSAEVPPFYVGITYDGGEGIYLGKVAASDGTTLRLAGATYAPANGGEYDWAGAIAQIVDGTGAGQWRYLAHAGAGASSVEVDRPWDIEPDASSTVNLVNLQGRVLMVANDFAQEQTNQQYFFAVDVVKAGNTYGVDGAKAGDLSWMGKHYRSLSPGWHLQLLDNRVVRGAGSYFKAGVMDKTVGYAGASGAYQVFRNNRAPRTAATSLSLTSKQGHVADAVIEGNDVATIDLGPNPSDPIDASGIVLRHNTGALGGNLAGKSTADDAGVRILR
jgi:hypothetical protein